MAKKILHLRGTKEEYERYGVKVGDGELALERREGAPTRIKIGDGETPYGDLPYFGKTVRRIKGGIGERTQIELLHGYELIVGLDNAYELVLPDRIEDDYECKVFLYTSIRPPSLTYPSAIVFLGDSTEGGLLRPAPSTSYLISFQMCDGTVYGTVKAAPLALAYEAYSEIEEKLLSNPSSILFKDNKNILDISLAGFFDGGDTDGYLLGLGNFDYDEEKFRIEFEATNAHLFSFAQMKSSALQYKSRLSAEESENGFIISVKNGTLVSVIGTSMLKPASGIRYRVQCKVRLIDSTQSQQEGTTILSPFSVRYSNTKSVSIPMTAQSDGTFLVDYLSDENLTVMQFYFTQMDEPTTVEIYNEGFAFYAQIDGAEPPLVPELTNNVIYLDAPLLAANEVCDTLSLSSMTITRRIYADFIYTFSIYSTAGDYTAFYVDLPIPMAKGGDFLLEDFERIDDIEMLPFTPYSYVVDEKEKKLIFTGGEDQTDIESMLDYVFYELETLCYAYERETPIIERVEGDINFRHYENFMALRFINAHSGRFILKQYSEKKGE